MLDKHKDWTFKDEDGSHYTRVDSIRSLFQGNGAFIHAPKAWVLFIGAMLWRIRYSATNSNNDPILYSGRNGRKYTGIADNKFVITVTPQKLIAPHTKQYPMNAVAIITIRIITPTVHTASLGFA